MVRWIILRDMFGQFAVFLSCFVFAFICGSLVFVSPDSDAVVQPSLFSAANSSLAASISPSILSLKLVPSASGATVEGEMRVSVTTDNITGYSTSLSSYSEAVNLTHVDGSSSITPVVNSDAATPSPLQINTWGFGMGSASATSTYLSVPPVTTPREIINKSTAVDNDTSIVTIAAKVNTSIPSGYYTNTIVFTTMTNVAPPANSYPTNISSTNPGIIDVYPTTGYAGEVVTITSDALFTSVRNVTIGGTACTRFAVVSTSVLACELPTRPNGSVNEIAVMNGPSAPGTNVTPADTYNHMKVTYFDPSTPRGQPISIDGNIAMPYFANGFTSQDCSNLVPSNSAELYQPDSIAYVRDQRNNQVYKVKRMIDQKCWMIDNLKYIDGSIVNTADNTVGMTFNNRDDRANTVDGTATVSAANFDKAFFNSNMRLPGCYTIDPSIMATNTLTHCGYLYNWYAATAGTGYYSVSTNGTQATGSICPDNFRLPSSRSTGAGNPTGNGTSQDGADFPVLNASMNAGYLTAGRSGEGYSYPEGWLPSGAFFGTLAGTHYLGYTRPPGDIGIIWSSTGWTTDTALQANWNQTVATGGAYSASKFGGLAVRCVLR